MSRMRKHAGRPGRRKWVHHFGKCRKCHKNHTLDSSDNCKKCRKAV